MESILAFQLKEFYRVQNKAIYISFFVLYRLVKLELQYTNPALYDLPIVIRHHVIYATSSYIIHPYFGKETIETFLAITFIISVHKAVCSKRIKAMLTNETICMIKLVLVIQLFLFRLNLTTTMSATSCRAATTLVKKNIRYIYEWNCNAT